MQPIAFKFQPLDGRGNATGFLARKGAFDGHTLTLGKEQAPAEQLIRADHRHDRIVIVGVTDDQPWTGIYMIHGSGVAKNLARAINQQASRRLADQHEQELTQQGQGDRFRSETCPCCASTVDLTGFSPTPQVYCGFCHALFLAGEDTADADYRTCEQCGMYARSREVLVFYFYFLLAVYGWRTQRRVLCRSCLRRAGWKMTALNLPFVLGLPVGLTQLSRSYLKGTSSEAVYPGLDEANRAVRRGKPADAAEQFDAIAEEAGAAAGVRANAGQALLNAGRHEDAAVHFELALQDCANYRRAAEGLALCLKHLGRQEDLDLLQAQWSDDDQAIAALASDTDAPGGETKAPPAG